MIRISQYDNEESSWRKWITPNGEVINIGTMVHDVWAKNNVLKDEDLGYSGNPNSHALIMKGWIRINNHGFNAELKRDRLSTFKDFFISTHVARWRREVRDRGTSEEEVERRLEGIIKFNEVNLDIWENGSDEYVSTEISVKELLEL